MENDYISHHGIKGQKWGVRRFQKYVNNALARMRDFTSTDYYMYKFYDPKYNTDFYRPQKLLTNKRGYD